MQHLQKAHWSKGAKTWAERGSSTTQIQGAGGDDGAFGDDLPAFFRSLLALPIVFARLLRPSAINARFSLRADARVQAPVRSIFDAIAEAALTAPLRIFILPRLFIVLLGPAAINVMDTFKH
jgi:hypothetical protein